MIEYIVEKGEYLAIISLVFVLGWYLSYWATNRPIPTGAIRVSIAWAVVSVVIFFPMVFVSLIDSGILGDGSNGKLWPMLLVYLTWLSIIPFLLYKTVTDLRPNAKIGSWNCKEKWKKFRKFLGQEKDIRY